MHKPWKTTLLLTGIYTMETVKFSTIRVVIIRPSGFIKPGVTVEVFFSLF